MRFFLQTIHPPNQMKIEEGGKQDDKNKLWSTPTVKNNTSNKKQDIFILFVNYKIEEQKDGNKIN